MLGIGQIEQRIGELIKGAMPFAIVNNGTNSDGTVRPISRFARLISYPTVQQALDAGATRIEVATGLYPSFNVTTNYVSIKGAGRDTFIDGGITDHAVYIAATGVTIENLSAETTTGGGTDFDAFHEASGLENTFWRCWVRDSDRCAFNMQGSDTHVINCHVEGSDHLAIASHQDGGGGGSAPLVMGCKVEASGHYGIYVHDEGIAIGNHIMGNCAFGISGNSAARPMIVNNMINVGGANDIRLSSATDVMVNGNIVNGSITSESSGTVTDNEAY